MVIIARRRHRKNWEIAENFKNYFLIIKKTVLTLTVCSTPVQQIECGKSRRKGLMMTKDTISELNIPFSPPDVGEEEIAEVADALRSGWITTGPKVKKLEKLIAEWIGVGFTEKGTPRCVALNSQTACAEMALRVMGIGADAGGSVEDEVIVPAYTYTASASIVLHVKAKLRIVDIQKDKCELDYNEVEKVINEHTKAIIPVDIGGVPCNYKRLFDIVNKKQALFIPANDIQKKLGRVAIMADTAHAFGAKLGDNMIGNVADFSSFSWHAVKNFTTGEGGCVTWKHINGIDDDEIYHQFQLLSLHGQSKDALNKNKPGMWEYDIVGPWYKCNLTDIMAAIGLAQFRRYPSMLKRRKEIIEKYDAALEPLGVKTLPHYTDKHTSCGHLYITRVFKKDGKPISDAERREIIIKMAEVGVSCNVHYKPLPMHTAYENLGFNIKDYPNAFDYYANAITLPLHTCLTDEQVEYVIKKYIEILREYIR